MLISRRLNNFWIGLALGIVLPLFVILFIYLFGYSNKTFSEFLAAAIIRKVLPKILSLCVIPNLAVFYFFLNKEFWYATRGVIAATLLCTISIVIIKFLA